MERTEKNAEGDKYKMKKCRITVMKTARYDDLIEKYEESFYIEALGEGAD